MSVIVVVIVVVVVEVNRSGPTFDVALNEIPLRRSCRRAR
jgi:hypothetical protein